MEQPLYQLIALAVREYGLLAPFQEHFAAFMTAFVVLALICCLFGFYCYRAMASGLVFFCVLLIGGLLVKPAAGALTAVTFGAVMGVSAAFLAFRWYRFGAVALCAAITGNFLYVISIQAGFSTPVMLVLTGIGCLAGGALTFVFPFWGVCGFTAIWGAAAFAMEGWRLLPMMQEPLSVAAAAGLGVVLFAVGLACQLRLFRRQELFARIMPERMEYALQKRKGKQGVSA